MEKRPALSESSLVLLSLANIASGKIANEADQAVVDHLDVALKMISLVQDKSGGEDTGSLVKGLLADLQCQLMAYRKDDFFTIQQEGPFCPQGRENLVALVDALRSGGKEKVMALYRELETTGRLTCGKNEVTSYSGGPGDNRGNAVVIHAKNGSLGVATEYWYLSYTYGAVTVVDAVTVTGTDGKVYDQVRVDDYKGERKSVFFDVSEFARRRSAPPPAPVPPPVPAPVEPAMPASAEPAAGKSAGGAEPDAQPRDAGVSGDFKMACPHCSQHLAATEDLVGIEIECPSCSKPIQIVKPGQSAASGDGPAASEPLPPAPVPAAGPSLLHRFRAWFGASGDVGAPDPGATIDDGTFRRSVQFVLKSIVFIVALRAAHLLVVWVFSPNGYLLGLPWKTWIEFLVSLVVAGAIIRMYRPVSRVLGFYLAALARSGRLRAGEQWAGHLQAPLRGLTLLAFVLAVYIYLAPRIAACGAALLHGRSPMTVVNAAMAVVVIGLLVMIWRNARPLLELLTGSITDQVSKLSKVQPGGAAASAGRTVAAPVQGGATSTPGEKAVIAVSKPQPPPPPPVIRASPAAPMVRTMEQEAAFGVACFKGDVDGYRAMLDRDPALVTSRNGGGVTLLHLVAWSGNVEIAKLLLARGADVNAADKNGTTPLHMAALYGRGELAEFLLANKAGINAKAHGCGGVTPLQTAREKGFTEVVALLRRHGGV